MTIEAQVQQILLNQNTILTNQAQTNVLLASIDGTVKALTLPAADLEPVLTAVNAVAAQVTDVQAQLETPPEPVVTSA